MSRIDNLVDKLCPNGVVHQLLGQIADYSKTRVDATELDDSNFVGVDNLLSNKKGKTEASYLPNTARLTAYEAGDILLGNIRPYLKKVWLATTHGGCSGDVLAVRILSTYRETIDPNFLYYVLSSDSFFAYSMRHAKGAKMPRGNKDAIMKYRVPTPPLQIQQEIVRILDQFTKLEASLESELEARRRQYDYYSKRLLSRRRGEILTIPLGDAVSTIIDHRGKTPKKLGGDWSDNGHRVISALNMKNGRVDDNDHHYIDGTIYSRWMREPLRAGDILLTSEAPLGAVAYIDKDVDWAIGQRIFGLRPRRDVLDGKYLFHLLRAGAPREELLARSTGSTVSGIRQSELVKISLELPPISEQQHVVELLDKFEELTGSLVVGLPAELVARRKQYEYYRDRLLTFEEAAV